MEEAEKVFEFSLYALNIKVSDYVKRMNVELDVSVIKLNGEHVAQNGGLLINVNPDKALNPEGIAKNSFFSLDLNLLTAKMKEMTAELELSEEEQQQVLTNVTRDNMTACYVLLNGNINTTKFIVTGNTDERTKAVIEKAYQELTESGRMEAMNEMISKRKHGSH